MQSFGNPTRWSYSMAGPSQVPLPKPPGGKTGWPWEAPAYQPHATSAERLPKFSIITPSFNQGDFIEETIRSVLLQGYPSIEMIVIDGGSTDQTRQILAKYDASLAYWVSEPDRGQSNALNKGLAKATGDIIGWLNSDDIYCPNALWLVAEAYMANPASIIAGNVLHFDEEKEWFLVGQDAFVNGITTFWRPNRGHQQPGVFIPRSIFTEVGPIDESLAFCMDFDLFCRLEKKQVPAVLLDQVVAKFRRHPCAKTSTMNRTMRIEQSKVARRYFGSQELHLEHDLTLLDGMFYTIRDSLRSLDFRSVYEELYVASRLDLLGKLAEFAVRKLVGKIKSKLSCNSAANRATFKK